MQYYTIMSDLEKRRIDREFEIFSMRNFEKPKKCKNLDQVRFYLQEVSAKVQEFKSQFNYVPDSAYQLLAQYNALLNSMVLTEFKNTY